MIKDLTIEQLRTESGKILSKAYFELGQNPDEDTIVSMSLTLAEDLKSDFSNLSIIDIKQSFRNGVRGEEFHINVKTYYKWINKQKQLIWDNDAIDHQFKDKRLAYRNPNNTGLKTIKTTIKQLKQIQ